MERLVPWTSSLKKDVISWEVINPHKCNIQNLDRPEAMNSINSTSVLAMTSWVLPSEPLSHADPGSQSWHLWLLNWLSSLMGLERHYLAFFKLQLPQIVCEAAPSLSYFCFSLTGTVTKVQVYWLNILIFFPCNSLRHLINMAMPHIMDQRHNIQWS